MSKRRARDNQYFEPHGYRADTQVRPHNVIGLNVGADLRVRPRDSVTIRSVNVNEKKAGPTTGQPRLIQLLF